MALYMDYFDFESDRGTDVSRIRAIYRELRFGDRFRQVGAHRRAKKQHGASNPPNRASSQGVGIAASAYSNQGCMQGAGYISHAYWHESNGFHGFNGYPPTAAGYGTSCTGSYHSGYSAYADGACAAHPVQTRGSTPQTPETPNHIHPKPQALNPSCGATYAGGCGRTLHLSRVANPSPGTLIPYP